MAEDKKNRKSSRHFNLEKPIERHFEIEKDADILAATPTKSEDNKPQPAAPIAPVKKQEDVKKPSVTPKAEDVKKPTASPKVEEVKKSSVSPVKKPEETKYVSNGDDTEGKSSKWKWLIPAALVAVAVPSYFMFTGNDNSTPTEDQIVMNTSDSGQNNANDDAAAPNIETGENGSSENVDNSVGGNDVEDSGNTENSDNSANNTGSSPSETGSVGNTSSVSTGTTQSSDAQSPSNNPTISGQSASSTASTKSGNDKAGNTVTSSGQGKSVPNSSINTGTKDASVIPGSIEQKALDVIRGVFGNGQVRKDKLGAEYAEIQKLVNEMYRTGKVH